jgi:hypothetical protein
MESHPPGNFFLVAPHPFPCRAYHGEAENAGSGLGKNRNRKVFFLLSPMSLLTLPFAAKG